VSEPTIESPDTALLRMAERGAQNLRLAYVFPAYWILTETLHWREFSIRYDADLLWPVLWTEGLDPARVGPTVLGASAFVLVACSVLHHFRWARICAACALTEYLALRFSLGKIHHSMHGWLLCLWLWCWLPKGWLVPQAMTRRERLLLLRRFHTCQLLIAATYTLSGVGKIIGAGYQWWRGEPTLFGLESVAKHTAARLLETPDHALFGDWVVRHGAWLWPGTMAVLALQLGAVYLARRPRHHIALGAGLVTFHAFTALFMGIDFTPAVLLCAVLFLASPFTTTLPACR
jgi:hypothetical protein